MLIKSALKSFVMSRDLLLPISSLWSIIYTASSYWVPTTLKGAVTTQRWFWISHHCSKKMERNPKLAGVWTTETIHLTVILSMNARMANVSMDLITTTPDHLTFNNISIVQGIKDILPSQLSSRLSSRCPLIMQSISHNHFLTSILEKKNRVKHILGYSLK